MPIKYGNYLLTQPFLIYTFQITLKNSSDKYSLHEAPLKRKNRGKIIQKK